MSRDMTDSEAIANLNHIYGIVSPDIQRSLDVAFKAMKRPQGEWIGNAFDEHHCNRCGHPALWEEEPDGYYEVQSRFCPNCGADMRKPNCVTCDHFGKCEGCEKGEEE